MTVAEDLLAGQTARFARLDRALPAAVEPPEGDVVTAALPDGSQVAGVLVRSVIAPDSPAALWSALDSWELYPLLGGAPRPGGAARAAGPKWRRMLDLSPPGPDSACTIIWPSRDAEAGRALLDHGFVPLTAVAVRQSGMASAPGKGPVRRAQGATGRRGHRGRAGAGRAAYSTLVGGTVARPSAARVKRDTVAAHIEGGDLVLLAELDGVTVGLAECWTNNAEPGSWAETRLRPRALGLRELPVRAARRARRGGGQGVDGAGAPRAAPGGRERHLPLLQRGEPALLGVLGPTGIPSTVDAVGDPARGRVAVNDSNLGRTP